MLVQHSTTSINRFVLRDEPAQPMTVRLSILMGVVAILLTSCSSLQKSATPTSTNNQEPILQVKQSSYTFSMYPQYKNETQSSFKLDIRNKRYVFVNGVRVFANLRAQDGHSTKANFSEDPSLEKYIAEVALKHHEDYVIDTHIEMPNSSKSLFMPRFSFHCCDPVPETTDQESPLPTEGRALR